MQRLKTSSLLSAIALASTCGPMMGDEPYERHHSKPTPLPNDNLCCEIMSVMEFTIDERLLFEEGDIYAINNIPLFKNQTVVGVQINHNQKYTVLFIRAMNRDGLKQKTKMWQFSGTSEEKFYKQAIMYLYMTSNQRLKQLLLKRCFGVTSVPKGLSELLKEPRLNVKGQLESAVNLIAAI